MVDPPKVGNMVYYPVLCGLLTGHVSDEDPQRDIPPSRYGVGVMLRSHEIKEALMTDERREERRRWDAELAAARQARQPSVQDTSFAEPPSEPDEFGRFEDLSRMLVQVPKKELDDKLKEGKD
jgi:hypothetical protein